MILKEVEITSDVKASLSDFLTSRSYSQVAVLVDQVTAKHCLQLIKPVLPPDFLLIEIPSGEESKELNTCLDIWGQLTDRNFDRKSVLINIGGGVIGDMGGFCAGTYKRGIEFINLPTTLLAQVDASVGGKLGVDFKGFKNHIGLFKKPNKVLISTEFLETLPKLELRSGFAEVIKHCLIRDRIKFAQIRKKGLEDHDWADIIAHSVAIKSAVVREDPTEKGLRKILNFGHTIGHAIETFKLSTGDKILHGEGVAAGMICESYLSHKLCGLDISYLKEITDYLVGMYGKIELNESDFGQLIETAYQDKKNESGVIKAALLEEIGMAIYDISLSEEDIKDALNYYTQLATPKG